MKNISTALCACLYDNCLRPFQDVLTAPVEAKELKRQYVRSNGFRSKMTLLHFIDILKEEIRIAL